MEFTFLTPRGTFINNQLTLNEPYSEEKEKEAEFRFPRGTTKLLMHGKPFTHTQMGVPIEIVQGDERKTLTLDFLEGSGDFSLHVYFGKPMEGDQLILALKALRRDDKVVIAFRWD